MELRVNNVDKDIFKEFKVETRRLSISTGLALTLAMKLWLDQRKNKVKKSLLDFKPQKWGKCTERISEEIDEILYGN